jgi:hypothetical protein
VLRNVSKDALKRAQQGIGTKRFSYFRHHHAQSNSQQKIELCMF